MTQRYFIPPDWSADQLEMTGTEAHHFLHVMRGQPGTEIEVFDGTGGVAQARIVGVNRKSAKLELIPKTHRQTSAPARSITLATAIPKGDRFRWLIEKATELGVQKIIPLQTERGVVNPRETKLEKHRQYIIEACKQSGRNHLLQLESQQSLSVLCDRREQTIAFIGMTQPDSARQDQSCIKILKESTDPILLVVGPEGGFTADEIQFADQAGMYPWTIGPHILRTETAGIALAATVAALLDQ